MPSSPEDAKPDLADVELIDNGPFVDTPLAAPANETMERAPFVGTTTAAVVAAVVIIGIFALIARPGLEQDVASNERAQTTLPPAATTAPTTSIPGTDASGVENTTTLRPIPPFDGGPPQDLPGVISGLDERGALVVIDRNQLAPIELLVGLVPVEQSQARSLLAIGPRSLIGLDSAVTVRSHLVEVIEGGEVINGVNLAVLTPEGEPPNVLLVDRRPSTLGVMMYEPDTDRPVAEWTLTRGLDVLGSWGEELILHRAGRVWALTQGGTERVVAAEGDVLGFDGTHLVRLSCPTVDGCEVIVGTIEEPELHRVALPDQLEVLAVDDWASSIAVSPDGHHLALSVRDGGLSLPTMLDLETGQHRQLADGMNHRSPVAWSPEGNWLAYLFTDDVMAWSLDADRSWRITINRELKTLAWQ